VLSVQAEKGSGIHKARGHGKRRPPGRWLENITSSNGGTGPRRALCNVSTPHGAAAPSIYPIPATEASQRWGLPIGEIPAVGGPEVWLNVWGWCFVGTDDSRCAGCFHQEDITPLPTAPKEMPLRAAFISIILGALPPGVAGFPFASSVAVARVGTRRRPNAAVVHEEDVSRA